MGVFYDLAREVNKGDPKARRPYKWGSKAFLINMKVGQEIEFKDDESLSYRGLQYVAAHLRRIYGCQFSFTTYISTGQRIIRRVA